MSENTPPMPTQNSTAEVAWIEWAGGDCPVSPDAIVEIKRADGSVPYWRAASRYNWDGGFVAYRVVRS